MNEMKKIIFALIWFVILLPFMLFSEQWVKTYGGSGNDRAYSIKPTSDGGYVVVGYTESFGAGERDIWVLKLDLGGDIEWQRAYGGWSIEWASSIQETSDGGYVVAGHTKSFGAGFFDIWIFKLDIDGDVEWQRTYGGAVNDYGKSVLQTSDGGYIVSGRTYSVGSGSCDGLVLKLNSAGAIEWQRLYGGADRDYIMYIQEASEGGIIVAGHTKSYGAGDYDIWIFKLDINGDIEWQRTYGGVSNEYVRSIQQTVDGGYIVSGRSLSFSVGGYDSWIIKLDSAGDIEWHYLYGGLENEEAHLIQQTSDGGYVVAGCAFSFGNGENDGWIIKLDSAGQIEWQRTYGGDEYDCVGFIQQISDGGYMLTGYTESFSTGGYDFWVIKLGADGNISPSCEFDGISDAAVSSTGFLPGEPNITPQGTSLALLDSNVSPYVTGATATLLCSDQEYSLTVSTSPGGTTDPSPDIYTYYGGKRVTLTAIPDSGYVFNGWSGDASGTENPITIIMDENKSIAANFVMGHTLTIAATEGGSTFPNPGSYNYGAGEEVTITANPYVGYIFNGWTGDVPQGNENDNPLTITVDSDKSITANFIWPCQLIITAGKGGTTDPLPGTYIYGMGTEVRIAAIPEEGYEFVGWSVDATGLENPITMTMDEDRLIAASFSGAGGEEEKSFWELDCFIATAAYGSPLHPHVEALRDFRDEYLMQNKLGRWLVAQYYRYSPFIAKQVAKSKILKVAVRSHLLPLVAVSYSTIRFGPIITGIVLMLIFVFPVFITWKYRKRCGQYLNNKN